MESYGDVLQDIPAVLPDPGNDIFNDSLLAPPPLLAAPAALDTGLFRYQDSPSLNKDTFTGIFLL